MAQACKAAADAGDWHTATDLWRETEYIIWDYTNYIDFYNVLKYVVFDSSDTKQELYDSEEKYQEARKREMKKQLRKYLDFVLENPEWLAEVRQPIYLPQGH